jgi:hypothetical protein
MRTTIAIIVACLGLCRAAKTQTNVPDVSVRLIGTWKAGDTYLPPAPLEMWQDIKNIIFRTNGIVKWSEVRNGEMVEMTGRYMIQPDNRSKRELPMLFVAPTNYPNPMLSSICLLRLSDLEIDSDLRFPVESCGKALKAVAADGKRVVFIRATEAAD